MGRGKKSPGKEPATSTTNRPRNHLITDATKPFDFSFRRYGVLTTITVHQTPQEDTWPGGALWDLGVLLAQVLVQLTRGAELAHKTCTLPSRLAKAVPDITWKNVRVLELGCGVGLTGMVAAALGAQVTLLTDLQVVVDQVTRRNVEHNTVPGPNKTCGYRTSRSGGRVAAVPLCWGNGADEDATRALLEKLTPGARRKSRGGGTRKREGIPDIILIGDVAYQHKPGAPSHFDALSSTLLKFVDSDTLVFFGTRMRMPASADLLEMFRQHMFQLVEPPLEAHELDPSFSENELGRKHNMTIHVLKLKPEQSQTK